MPKTSLPHALQSILASCARDGTTVKRATRLDLVGWYLDAGHYLTQLHGVHITAAESAVKAGYLAPRADSTQWVTWYAITDAGRAALEAW